MRPQLCVSLVVLPGSLLALAGCELTEVTVAPGERMVVVQSVVSRTQSRQFAVIEYSSTGEQIGRTPIGGAVVTIEHLGPGPCTGRVDTLTETRPAPPAFDIKGVYRGSICPPEPGARLSLRVETPAGELVRGSTTVPGASRRDITVGDQAAVASYDTLLFRRERDTIRINVSPVSARGLQVEARHDRSFDASFFAFVDTLGMTVAGNLVNPFEGSDGETVFRAGRYYWITVALADTNYYDFLRSRSDPFTGRGFLNHLEGGIGVFGSVEAESHILRVVAAVDDPREGRYRVTGQTSAGAVDVTLEAYLDDLQEGAFSAFVEGAWLGFSLRTSGDGFLGKSSGPPGLSSETLAFQFQSSSGDTLGPVVFTLHGTRSTSSEPFTLLLSGLSGTGREVLRDTLTAQQISGPGSGPSGPAR
ncbi:MAG: hypothetical protein HY337_04395 [Gemmatimonadetes bacterium]|nr:hypothetical protein [Gemmatimonadota bacterium]